MTKRIVIMNKDREDSMKQETLAALKDSIAHWERMVANPAGPDRPSAKQCALCGLFNPSGQPAKNNCLGCPVYEKTGQKYCEGTPYDDAAFARATLDWEELRYHALEELTFLRSLLPHE